MAEAMGLPDVDCYAAEIRDGIYRGDFRSGTPPQYHRQSRTPKQT